MAGVSGTVQPSITPTQTASVTVGITTTTPLTPVTSLPGHALTDTLPWVNYAVARPSGMELLTARPTAPRPVAHPPWWQGRPRRHRLARTASGRPSRATV
ncbi:MAG: hypothetical protein HZY76_17910 [Anaerolineae bacterium]|nr:MAG: hypothetical protein HZY76_17910 [Anaerolineae bacterium]